MAKYILADNQELTRYGLERLLRQDGNSSVFRASVKAQLMDLLKEHEDAVVLIDYKLFDIVDEEQLLIIGGRFASSQWILISDELTPQFLRRIIYSSHQFSVVFKDGSLKEIRDAILAVSRRDRYVCQRAMELMISHRQEEEKPELLTATEVEIVKAIAQGKTTKEIAEERFSSIHTVTTHRKNIFRKLGVNTAHEVVKYAIRSGLVDTSEFYI